MRICWLELTGNFREEPACPEEKCEQTVTPCFYKKNLNKGSWEPKAQIWSRGKGEWAAYRQKETEAR